MKAEEVLALVSGRVDEELLLRNEYLAAENEILRSKLKKRVPLTDDERIRLATLGKRLGQSALSDVAAIVTPKTILHWYRRLVQKKYDGSANRGKVGRPRISPALEQRICLIARENRSFSYDRISGALSNLGYAVSDESVANVLRRHGLSPTGGRRPKLTWAEFIAAHRERIVATDFFTVEVVTKNGLVCFFVLFFINLATRRVHLGGFTPHPNEAWMKQVAKNATMAEWGYLSGCTHLIMDRDTKYCAAFRSILESAGIHIIRLPPRSPNLNAFAERFVRSVKEECLANLVLFGESDLRHALTEYLDHYHEERNHQGKGNVLLFPSGKPMAEGPIECRERLGGMLKFYYRKAA